MPQAKPATKVAKKKSPKPRKKIAPYAVYVRVIDTGHGIKGQRLGENLAKSNVHSQSTFHFRHRDDLKKQSLNSPADLVAERISWDEWHKLHPAEKKEARKKRTPEQVESDILYEMAEEKGLYTAPDSSFGC